MKNFSSVNVDKKITIKHLFRKLISLLAFLSLIFFFLLLLLSAIFYTKILSAEALSETLSLNKISIVDNGLKKFEKFINNSGTKEEPVVSIPVLPSTKPLINDSNTIATNNSKPTINSQNPILENSNNKPVNTVKLKGKTDNVNTKTIAKLSRLYSSMKPEEAVAIMKHLDDQTIILILSKMEEDQAAKILASFNTDQAARLTQKMIKGN